MSVYLDDGDVRLHHGDAFDELLHMPSDSVHCIVTSPPFWNLRDYDVDGQIGLEHTPEAWCSRLVGVFAECRRVLRPDGVLWLEVGDTYASKARGSDAGWESSRLTNPGGSQKAQAASMRSTGERHRGKDAGYKEKDLVGAPWMLAFALRAAGWYLRADVIWGRTNPMPESVTDRPTKAHSYVFLLTKSARYFYDQDAISTPATDESIARAGRSSRYDDQLIRDSVPYAAARPRVKRRSVREGVDTNGGGQGTGEMTWGARANARTVWMIPTQPTPFAHFATFPQALVEQCIKAGTSEHGCCAQCGAPWQRVREDVEQGKSWTDHTSLVKRAALNGRTMPPRPETIGWQPTCVCSADVVPCTVLDPFMGSGTTALVARRLGRQAVGIELNAEYLAIAAERLQQLSLLGGAA